MNDGFKCVVVTLSAPLTHSPVENPAQRCSANSDGCGRPSIQIVRLAFSNNPVMVYAISRRDTGSMTSPMWKLGAGPRIEYVAGCGRAWCSGTAWIVEFQASAFCRPASLIGKPVKLPSSGPGLVRISKSSSFAVAHEPARSTIVGCGVCPSWADDGAPSDAAAMIARDAAT